MDADLGTLIIRLALGLMLVAHGLNKVFGEGGITGTAAWFAQLGLRPGWLHARLAATTEVGAGGLLAIGMATGPACIAFVGLMTVATLTDHRGKGYFVFKGGCEYTVLVGTVAVAAASMGPGRWSIDHAIDIDSSGWQWALMSVVTGVGAGLGLLAVARPANRDHESAAD